MMFNIDSIGALGTKPIPGDSPAGHECYELPEYTIVRNEIQKLSRVGQSSSIDWLLIIENSVTLLTHHSKDIQVATYLAYGLLPQYQFQGLATGLKILLDLISKFWEEAFPQGREKAKIEFLNWYATQSLNYLSHLQLVEGDEKLQKQIITSLKKIENELIDRKITPDFFSSLRKKVESVTFSNLPLTQKQEEKLDAELKESGQFQEPALDLDTDLLHFTKSARELMGREPSNVYAYYLNRIAAWGGVSRAPFHEEGLTLVKAPEYFNQERIKSVQEEGSLAEIVAAAEEMIPQEIFWLDLHFISLNALKKLDATFNPAFEVAKRELVNFVNRCPNIEKLKFSDGTPFLSKQYEEQLNTFTTRKDTSISSNIKTLSEVEQNQLKSIKELVSMRNTKNYQTDIAQIELLKKGSISDKVLLMSYMAICDLLLDENEQSILKPYLGFIVELIERHQLISWEPGLALEALVLVYRCMKFLRNTIPAHQVDHVFSLITQIDMNVALELSASRDLI